MKESWNTGKMAYLTCKMINLCYFLLSFNLQIDEIEELKKRHLEFHWVQNLSYRLTRLKHGLVISALNYANTLKLYMEWRMN